MSHAVELALSASAPHDGDIQSSWVDQWNKWVGHASVLTISVLYDSHSDLIALSAIGYSP